MTDNLRDRIAAALFNWDYPLSRHAWDEAEDHVREDFRHAADAVIREIPELRYAHVPQRIILSVTQASEDRGT